MTTRKSQTALLIGAISAALSGAPAHAQQPADEALVALEEIVVTAQRREQNLQKVPIAVTAYTSEQIEQMSLQSVGDVLDFAPNVTRASGPSGGGDGFFYIRGVGQVDNSVTVDPGVGTYIDEVYLGRLQGASMDLLDVERVEVLRGPQGTLFGRNTIGGAVNVTTADPGDEFGLKGRVIGGDRDRIDVQASVDVPVGEIAGVKVSGFVKQQDGWAENVYTGDTFGDVDDKGGRVKLVIEPTDSFRMKLAFDYADSSGSPINTSLSAFNAQQPVPPMAGPPGLMPATSPVGVPLPNLSADLSTNPEKSYVSVPDMFDEKTSGASMHFDLDLTDELTLRSITAYRQVEQQVYNDLDGTSYRVYDSYQDVDQDQISQELQLAGDSFEGRFKWLLGAYYFEESIKGATDICVGSGGWSGVTIPLPPPAPPGSALYPPGAPAMPFAPGCVFLTSAIDLDITSYAGFFHSEIGFTDQFKMILGLRYTEEQKEQTFDSVLDNTAGVGSLYPAIPTPGTTLPILGPSVPFQSPALYQYDESWSEVTPKVGFDFQQSEDVLWYLSWAQGFKSGGFGGRATNLAPIEAYDPETIDTYELGVKTELADGRVRLNANVFFSEYEDIQLLELNPLTLGFETKNAGTAEQKGLEVEMLARLTERFDVQFGAGYMDSEYTELNPGTEVDMDDELPMTPEWTGNLGLQYTFPLGALGSLSLRGDYNYRSEVSFQAGNDPYEMQDGYGLVNLRATFTTASERYYIAVYGTNVADEEYKVSAVDALSDLNVAISNYGPPREVGVEFGVRL